LLAAFTCMPACYYGTGVLSAGNLFAIDYATRATGLLRGVRTIQHLIADLLWFAMTSHKDNYYYYYVFWLHGYILFVIKQS
jgi:hypothetical protein